MPHKVDYKILWSHIDMNRHMRHSAYSDFATQARVDMMHDCGISANIFSEYDFGPVVFREEIKYLKEFELSDKLTVSTELVQWNKRRHFWTIQHQIIKNDDKIAAKILIEGAWLNIKTRKMLLLSDELLSYIDRMPKATNYKEV